MSRPKLSVPNAVRRRGRPGGTPVVEGERVVGGDEPRGHGHEERGRQDRDAGRAASPRAATWRAGERQRAAVAISAHPRVEGGLGDVGQQEDDRDQHGEHQGEPLHDRVVAAVDALDHQPSDARDGEDRLGHHRTADQRADAEAEQRHGRDQRVAQDVAEQDHRGRRPLARAKSTYSASSTSITAARRLRISTAARLRARVSAGRNRL